MKEKQYRLFSCYSQNNTKTALIYSVDEMLSFH